MKAIVHQALGDVHCFHASGVLQRARIQNAFMRHQTIAAAVEHFIVAVQALRNVVGVEQCHLRGSAHAIRAQQPNVSVRNCKHQCTAPRRSRYWPHRFSTANRSGRMPR